MAVRAIRPGRVALWVPLGVYLFVWPFGLGLLSLGWMPPGAGWVGGVLLIAQGLAFTAWLALQVGVARAVALAAGVATLAWALEAVGVTSGLPFGPYQYTPELGAWLGPVPAAIPCAWVASVGSAYFTGLWILGSKYSTGESLGSTRSCSAIQNPQSAIQNAIVGAALATALDGVLEPVATQVQGYWHWLTAPGAPGTLYAGIPLANFATWFGAALVLGLGIAAVTAGHWPRRPVLAGVPILLYGMNLVMFGVVNATHGFGGPAGLAAGLLGLLAVFGSRQQNKANS